MINFSPIGQNGGIMTEKSMPIHRYARVIRTKIGQISIFLNETNVIRFVPFLIYSLIHVKLLIAKKPLKIDKIVHTSVRVCASTLNNLRILKNLYETFRIDVKLNLNIMLLSGYLILDSRKIWRPKSFRKILALIFRKNLALILAAKIVV